MIDAIGAGIRAALLEIRKLDHILAFFDYPDTSNGPTAAISGRFERLRGSALGFRGLTNCIARGLLESGGFRPALHTPFVKSPKVP